MPARTLEEPGQPEQAGDAGRVRRRVAKQVDGALGAEGHARANERAPAGVELVDRPEVLEQQDPRRDDGQDAPVDQRARRAPGRRSGRPAAARLLQASPVGEPDDDGQDRGRRGSGFVSVVRPRATPAATTQRELPVTA